MDSNYHPALRVNTLALSPLPQSRTSLSSLSPLSRLSLKHRVASPTGQSPPASILGSPKARSKKFVPPPLALFGKTLPAAAAGRPGKPHPPSIVIPRTPSPTTSTRIIHNSVGPPKSQGFSFRRKDRHSSSSPSSDENLFSQHSSSPGSSPSSAAASRRNSRVSVGASSSKSGRRHSLVGKSCCICADEFRVSVGLANDRIISLSCGHGCHYECYLVMVDPLDVAACPACTVCQRPAKPVDLLDWKAIVETALAGTDHPHMSIQHPAGSEEPIIATTPVHTTPFSHLYASPPLDAHHRGLQQVILSYGAPHHLGMLSPAADGNTTPSTATTLQTPFVGRLGAPAEDPNTNGSFASAANAEAKSLVFHDEDLLDEITRPRLTLIPEYARLEINASTRSHALPCVLSVQMSDFCVNNHGKSADEVVVEVEGHKAVSNWVIENKLRNLDNFADFALGTVPVADSYEEQSQDYCEEQQQHDETGDILVMFDVLMVEEGHNWEPYHFYLFNTNKLLVVDERKNRVTGLIKYQEDLSSITEVNGTTIVLNLASLNLSELKVRSLNRLIIRKWRNYLVKKLNTGLLSPQAAIPSVQAGEQALSPQENAIALSRDLVPLIQMTTNSWDVITDPKIVPEEVKHMYELLHNNMELPLPLLKKLIPDPEPIPIRLIICVSLINKRSTGVSNAAYMAQVKKIVRDALEHLTPGVDKLGVVYISREHTKKISSYITDITSWAAMEQQFSYLKVYDDDGGGSSGMTNLEETALYLEATERLLQLWGDCRFVEEGKDSKDTIFAAGGDSSPKNNYKFIKKIIMVNDRFSESSASRASSEPDQIQNYRHRRFSKTSKKILREIIRDYKFSVHAYLVGERVDRFMIAFLQQLLSENYHTFGSNFARVRTLEDISVADLVENHFRRIVVPTMKVKVSSLKKEWVRVSKNELRNNQLDLLAASGGAPTEDNNANATRNSALFQSAYAFSATVPPSPPPPLARQSFAGADRALKLSGSSRDTGNVPDNLLTSLSVCSTPTTPRFAGVHASPGFFEGGYTEALAAGDERDAGEEDEDEDEDGEEIFINDICPGYSKSIMVSADMSFDRKFKQMFKHTMLDTATETGFYRCPLLEFSGAYGARKIAARDVDVEIGLAPSSSITRSSGGDGDNDDVASRASTVSTSTTGSGFELPILAAPMTSARDPLYAKRQIQLTVAGTLLCAIKSSEEEEAGGAETARGLLLGLVGTIFGMGRHCRSMGRLAWDFPLAETDVVWEEEQESRYVEYLSFLLGTVAELYGVAKEDARNSSYEMVCDLCFQ